MYCTYFAGPVAKKRALSLPSFYSPVSNSTLKQNMIIRCICKQWSLGLPPPLLSLSPSSRPKSQVQVLPFDSEARFASRTIEADPQVPSASLCEQYEVDQKGRRREKQGANGAQTLP